jgi:hypothetical protein
MLLLEEPDLDDMLLLLDEPLERPELLPRDASATVHRNNPAVTTTILVKNFFTTISFADLQRSWCPSLSVLPHWKDV